jgi:hypothetical protein
MNGSQMEASQKELLATELKQDTISMGIIALDDLESKRNYA